MPGRPGEAFSASVFSADGTLLAYGSTGDRLKIFDLESETVVSDATAVDADIEDLTSPPTIPCWRLGWEVIEEKTV